MGALWEVKWLYTRRASRRNAWAAFKALEATMVGCTATIRALLSDLFETARRLLLRSTNEDRVGG